jgi:aldehyde:ferredoxin oxidoreductase
MSSMFRSLKDRDGPIAPRNRLAAGSPPDFWHQPSAGMPEYYELRDWTPDGRPTAETLQRLNLPAN